MNLVEDVRWDSIRAKSNSLVNAASCFCRPIQVRRQDYCVRDGMITSRHRPPHRTEPAPRSSRGYSSPTLSNAGESFRLPLLSLQISSISFPNYGFGISPLRPFGDFPGTLPSHSIQAPQHHIMSKLTQRHNFCKYLRVERLLFWLEVDPVKD